MFERSIGCHDKRDENVKIVFSYCSKKIVVKKLIAASLKGSQTVCRPVYGIHFPPEELC